MVADDIGVDRAAAYGEHPHPERTPNIDALAARGVPPLEALPDMLGSTSA